jgi:hypothetical protein
VLSLSRIRFSYRDVRWHNTWKRIGERQLGILIKRSRDPHASEDKIRTPSLFHKTSPANDGPLKGNNACQERESKPEQASQVI